MNKRNEEEWEAIYASSTNSHKNFYPSELVIGFVKNHYNRLNNHQVRCLDIGCGWGNNLHFLRREGFDCYGIDLSKTAIEHLKLDFGNKVYHGSAVQLPYKNSFFDFIIDRSSIQHNARNDITTIFSEVRRVLKPGGKFFSVMLKDGENGFFVTRLSEAELKKELSEFSHFEINFSSHTKNFGRDLFSAYVIEADK